MASVATQYAHQLHTQEPLKFFITLMEFQKYEASLKKQPNALALLSGIVVYRHLPRPQQQGLLKDILSIQDGPLKGALYGIVGKITAMPYHYCWSLSDAELRAYFKSNDKSAKILGQLGFDLPPVTVAGLAAFVYAGFKGQMAGVVTSGIQAATVGTVKGLAHSNALVETARSAGLTKHVSATTGRLLGCFVILVICFKAMADTSAKDAKRELILRGLVDMEDL